MNRPLMPLAAVLLVLAVTFTSTAAMSDASFPPQESGARIALPIEKGTPTEPARALETLWIFDSDFSDLTGDNAGWFSYDAEGTMACDGYWHKDTLFTDSFPNLGDSAWWCGTYDECFEQGQGYGNNWTCVLARDFELSAWTTPSSEVRFEFDQRYAMEHEYDYGYVDVSEDDGATWSTIAIFNNTGFAGQPGFPRSWSSSEGHQDLDLTGYGGMDIRLRFRFLSDGAYSSEDSYDNAMHSVRNGAWQLDNFMIKSRLEAGAFTTHWTDDCESPGDNGWEHSAYVGSGQEAIFARYQFGVDLFTNRDPQCGDPPVGTWMMAAIDPATGRTTPGKDAWLLSPRIDVSGLTSIVGKWDMWLDIPSNTGDLFNLALANAAGDTCDIEAVLRGTDEDGQLGWYGGPFWGTYTDNWDAFAGGDWLKVAWHQWDEYGYSGERFGGFFLDRQRVGTVIGEPDPEIRPWRVYKDWFYCELPEAWGDYLEVEVIGFEPIVMQVDFISQGYCYPMYEDPENPGFWTCPIPTELLGPGIEFLYYVQGFDASLNSITYPKNAPDELLEFSMLPLGGDILLVDRHAGYAPGYDGTYQHRTAYYYESALDILGHTWDRWDSPDHTQGHSLDGPTHMGMEEYSLVIWFSGDRSYNVMTEEDQFQLADWMFDATVGTDRNLVILGNDIVTEIDYSGDPHGLMSNYMAVSRQSGTVPGDPLTVCDVAGGSDFITSPGGCSGLAAGCPTEPDYDILLPSQPDAEQALEYVDDVGGYSYGAAVAHTDATYGYSVVTYGFGVEYMEAASRDGGGLPMLVNLLANTLEFVEVAPDTTPTGVGVAPLANSLSPAYPNPLNPATSIGYSVREAGPVAIRVFSASGRLVRTLLEEELPEGRAGVVVWDGRDDRGEACGSGVFFYRIEAEGFESTQKMVLLK